MNKRVKELAEFAFNNANYPTDQQYRIVPNAAFCEKFAELIVKECIRVSEAHANDLESQPTDPLLEMYDNGIVSGIYEVTEAIKKHFGVE
jgi:hypothetical protein